MQEKTCFVIMPFGDKMDVNGEIIEFDAVYEHILEKAVEKLNSAALRVKCVRCDKIGEAGWIHSKMINHIMNCDIAIVDVTTANANVFYELGVRHALRRKVTVLVRKSGTRLPFNIEGFSVISYDFDWKLLGKAIDDIASAMRKGLAAPDTDSLVHNVIGDLRVERAGSAAASSLEKTEEFAYRLKNAPDKQLAILTGDLRNVRGIDVWVNAENTNMQMARFYDRSMSGIVRYYGARRNQAGLVVEDVIANELAAAMEGSFAVPPGHVIATGAGQLSARGVKRVLHAATVEGTLGGGYRPIQDIGSAVTNALEKVDQELAAEGLHSILFPIFGTGTGSGDTQTIARELLLTAVNYLAAHREGSIRKIVFLAQRKDQLEACQAVFRSLPELEPVS